MSATSFVYRPCETIRVPTPGGNFGMRIHPVYKDKRMHYGIDYAPTDKVKFFEEPVFCVASGTVMLAEYHAERGYQILVDHNVGGVLTRYQHLTKNLNVKKGDKVKAGTTIGRMGNSGTSTAQHLHFEVIVKGIPVDPEPWVRGLQIPGKEVLNMDIVYNGLPDVPLFLRGEIQELIDIGVLKGNAPLKHNTLKGTQYGDLDITHREARLAVINLRTCKYYLGAKQND